MPTQLPTVPTNPPTATTPPNPTATQPPSNSDISITSIFYDGQLGRTEPDEYVEIRNNGVQAINLGGWTLSDQANHVYGFPGYDIQPGQTCRVYTNENHPEWCGFSYGNGSAIWNNDGDCATLRDNTGAQVAQRCYS
ncbi:MAG: lamin tail domain-containing protein [Chloroflexi bacterium]|nr:lamin tail domain-containing protein [Chloroflexota bacterium]MBP8059777.1 lamin tail domain-containing protein [Chloroflexota bacterium]